MREALSALLISESCFIFLAIPNRSSHGPLRKCVRFLAAFRERVRVQESGIGKYHLQNPPARLSRVAPLQANCERNKLCHNADANDSASPNLRGKPPCFALGRTYISARPVRSRLPAGTADLSREVRYIQACDRGLKPSRNEKYRGQRYLSPRQAVNLPARPHESLCAQTQMDERISHQTALHIRRGRDHRA